MQSKRDNLTRWQFGLRQVFKAVFISAAILGAGIALYPVFDGHPVTMRRLNRVKLGMTKTEVATMLGEPSAEHPYDWRYSSWDWCFVSVRFDDSGLVTLVEHDH